MIGTWMTRLATSWLVYRLTHSTLILGAVDFSMLVPAFVLGPFAGVIVERFDKRTLLLWTQAAFAVQSLTMALLTFTNAISIREVIILSVVQGFTNSLDLPARQAFLPEAVEDRRDFTNAIAINSSMINGARLVGPAIAGLVIGAAGEAWCFAIDGVSYFAVIASLLMMRTTRVRQARHSVSMWHDMRDGWTYVTTFIPIRRVLTLFALIGLTAWPYSVLLPVFADQILKGGPHALAWLTMASGIGALVSALSLVLRRSVQGLLRIVPVAGGVLGVALIAFGLSRTLWLSLAFMLLVGFGMMQSLAVIASLIQTIVPDDKRGRVTSYYTMAFVGMAPIGSLVAGAVAQRIGAPATVMLSGSCCMAASIWFALKIPEIEAIVQPMYREMGLVADHVSAPVVVESEAIAATEFPT